MKNSNRPYTQFLRSAVKQRKRLIKMGKGYRHDKRIQSTIMHCEDLLMRFPSDEAVKRFMIKYYDRVRELIPARSAEDKQLKFLKELTHA